MRSCNFLSSSAKLKNWARFFQEIARCFASCVTRRGVIRRRDSASKVRSFDLATRSITPLIRQIALFAGMHVARHRRNSAQYLRQVVPIFRGRESARRSGYTARRRILESRRGNTTILKPPDFLVKTALKGGSRWH